MSQPPKRRSSPVRAKAREAAITAILEAVEDEALEAGLDGLTIAAVAGRAGVAVGTLYNYFPDREGMIDELFRRRRAAIIPRIAALGPEIQGMPFEDALRKLVHRTLEILESERRFLRLAVQIERDSATPRPRDPTLLTMILESFEKVLRSGARRKLFPARQVEVYAHMANGVLRSVVRWRIERAEAIDGDGDLIVDTLLHGIVRER